MANTPGRGYYYPGPFERPSGPLAIEQLALSVEADTQDLDTRLIELEFFESSLKVGTIGGLTTNANGDGNFAIPGGGYLTALHAAVLTDATAITGLGAIIIKWTSASSTKTTVTFRVYDAAGIPIPNITAASNLALGFMLVGS